MRVFVRYDKQGAVVSVAKADVLAEGLDHPFGDVADGETVIEVAETPELQALAPHEIHEQYRVDVKKKKLRKQ